MKRLLLLGATGQVGWELERALMPLGQAIVPDRAEYDGGVPHTLSALVARVQPDIVVNAAAYTPVDAAEHAPEIAFAINAAMPGALAAAAKRCGALLVHYSTDYVFDGEKADPYVESDRCNPINVYGASKLAGEQAVAEAGGRHIIFRTSWVYAARGTNFLRTILRLAVEREQLRVVADQVGAPTWARQVAETTAAVLSRESSGRDALPESGIFHLAASGAVTWHGFAEAIVAGARARGAPVKCRHIEPITSAEYPTAARRPRNSRLATDKLAQLGIALPGWEEGLRLCLDDPSLRIG